MAQRIEGTTPKQDGFFMPAEFARQKGVWMIWPERPDNWRDGAKPAQATFADVACAISKYEPVTVGASVRQYANARAVLPPHIRVVELESNDAWMRDEGPTFLIDGKGGLRAVDWTFNAWGGLYDGLYFPWDADDTIAQKVCEIENVDSYRTEGFVLEGGSFHVDGRGTVLTTEMCLLSPGRNPQLTKEQIEKKLCDYLGAEKVIWLTDGIDPDETDGHVDDVACFTAPGEIALAWTDDPNHPFYEALHKAYDVLSQETDARGNKLKVHKITLPKNLIKLSGAETIDRSESSAPRCNGDVCIASYINFLICNDAIIVPQYDDENDALALEQLGALFPDREAVGVHTREVVFGGGNIHCITQQIPEPRAHIFNR